MSIWVLVVAGLVAWTLVAVAVGTVVGKMIARGQRGGYIDFLPATHQTTTAAGPWNRDTAGDRAA